MFLFTLLFVYHSLLKESNFYITLLAIKFTTTQSWRKVKSIRIRHPSMYNGYRSRCFLLSICYYYSSLWKKEANKRHTEQHFAKKENKNRRKCTRTSDWISKTSKESVQQKEEAPNGKGYNNLLIHIIDPNKCDEYDFT